MLQKFFKIKELYKSWLQFNLHEIEKYKRHCALESAAYIKHVEPKKVRYSDLQRYY